MNAGDRDLRQMLKVVAAQAGARLVEIRTTGSGHKRGLMARGGRTVAVICPSTPSDRRSMLNTQADARRLLRRLTS
jgi:hypothetical protein